MPHVAGDPAPASAEPADATADLSSRRAVGIATLEGGAVARGIGPGAQGGPL
ncbi:MAG: hypothetical protein H0U76_26210 [Ktedonobacteraceae bacterium]|nr:hypothetical protein [Ktedonobacteraceae bacterium]